MQLLVLLNVPRTLSLYRIGNVDTNCKLQCGCVGMK